MRHPKTRINLADALGGKIANEKPLAAGDVFVHMQGRSEYRIMHGKNDPEIALVNISCNRLELACLRVGQPDRIIKSELDGLFCHLFAWRGYARINLDGSETPLSEIYAEKVEVWVGSWLNYCRDGDVFFICRDLDSGLLGRAWPKNGRVVWSDVGVGAGYGNSVGALTTEQIEALMPHPLSHYTLLSLADALEMLGKMEGE